MRCRPERDTFLTKSDPERAAIYLALGRKPYVSIFCPYWCAVNRSESRASFSPTQLLPLTNYHWGWETWSQWITISPLPMNGQQTQTFHSFIWFPTVKKGLAPPYSPLLTSGGTRETKVIGRRRRRRRCDWITCRTSYRATSFSELIVINLIIFIS